MSATPPLTARQARFVLEYGVDANGRRAAVAAGYSPRTAKAQASRLLTNVNVARALAAAQATRAAALGVDADRLANGLAALAFANVLDYLTLNAQGDPVVDLSALSPVQAAALQQVVVETYVDGRGVGARRVKRVQIKIADKRRALVHLAKLLGLDAPAPARPAWVAALEAGETDRTGGPA